MDPAQALVERQKSLHRIINETIARQESPVQQFYAGAVVLVTGASGFLGKQLIEKLLRSCQIKKIYILLRTKKDRTIQERQRKMLDDPVYEYLYKNLPNFVDKIVPVAGDVTEPRLGISPADWSTIIDEVDIIFHGAATIQFTEPLKKATLTNVRGTREMLLLGKACKRLRSFVHISTAYSHATDESAKQLVLEEFYKCSIEPDDLIQIVEENDDKELDDMTPEIIKGWPNTYSFTKAVAEEAVRTLAGDLPICIVRPAIVTCAYREPCPAWLDRSNVFGPSGFVAGSGLGFLHVIYADDNINLDLVPVDLVNNAIIAAAHETALRRARNESDVKIYTVTASRNPITFGYLIETISTEGRQFSTPYAIWYCFAITSKYKPIFIVLSWLLHYIPGYLLDGVLRLLGKKAIFTNLYKKVHKLNEAFGFYMHRDWKFEDLNLRQLYWNLSPTDRIIFHFNTSTIDWKLCMVLWCIGCRQYVLKDGLKDTEKAFRKQYWLKVLHYILMTLLFYGTYKIFQCFFLNVVHYLIM